MKRVFLELLFILIMIAGGMVFFIGALGTLNEGFRNEIKGAPFLLITGLGLMFGSWALSCKCSRKSKSMTKDMDKG